MFSPAVTTGGFLFSNGLRVKAQRQFFDTLSHKNPAIPATLRADNSWVPADDVPWEDVFKLSTYKREFTCEAVAVALATALNKRENVKTMKFAATLDQARIAAATSKLALVRCNIRREALKRKEQPPAHVAGVDKTTLSHILVGLPDLAQDIARSVRDFGGGDAEAVKSETFFSELVTRLAKPVLQGSIFELGYDIADAKKKLPDYEAKSCNVFRRARQIPA